MKQLKVFYVIAAIILLSGIMYSCARIIFDDEENGNGSSSSNGNNNLKTGQIEIKVTPNSVNKVEFNATARKITIDWGDGSTDELTPNSVRRNFAHEYPNQNLQNIKVNTEGMTSFNCANNSGGIISELRFGNCPELTELNCNSNQLTVLDVNKCTTLTVLSCNINQLTVLDVSKCTTLAELSCGNNQLTVLDVSKCTALTKLYCIGNKLTASALTTLLISLPTRIPGSGAVIQYAFNPGTYDCDKTIAEIKGWFVFLAY